MFPCVWLDFRGALEQNCWASVGSGRFGGCRWRLCRSALASHQSGTLEEIYHTPSCTRASPIRTEPLFLPPPRQNHITAAPLSNHSQQPRRGNQLLDSDAYVALPTLMAMRSCCLLPRVGRLSVGGLDVGREYPLVDIRTLEAVGAATKYGFAASRIN